MKPYSDKPDSDTVPAWDPKMAASLRASALVIDHGTPADQKNRLVQTILTAFNDPEDWPIDESARIRLLKELYRQALRVRQTEQAIAEDRG